MQLQQIQVYHQTNVENKRTVLGRRLEAQFSDNSAVNIRRIRVHTEDRSSLFSLTRHYFTAEKTLPSTIVNVS